MPPFHFVLCSHRMPLKRSIAAYNDQMDSSIAALVPHLNSIFTTEALTAYSTLTSYVTNGSRYFLLTDSLSVLRALQKTSLCSPRVVILLQNTIYRLLTSHQISLTLVWCRGHKDIPLNKVSDSLARNGPYLTHTLIWLAPEDLASQMRCDWMAEKTYS